MSGPRDDETARNSSSRSATGRRLVFSPSLPDDDPHIIRLRGPWTYQPLARTEWLADGTTRGVEGDLPPPGRIHMPSDWGDTLGADFRGRVLYTRSFGRPTGLTASECVDLVIEQVDAFGSCSLNGQPLGKIELGAGALCVEITKLLRPRNVLEIEVELPQVGPSSAPLPRRAREGQPGGLIGEVRLEIYEAAEL